MWKLTSSHSSLFPLFKRWNARCDPQLKKTRSEQSKIPKSCWSGWSNHPWWCWKTKEAPGQNHAKSPRPRCVLGDRHCCWIAIWWTKKRIQYLVGGFSPTHLKNMRTSHWIMKPQDFRGENSKNMFELPPPRILLQQNAPATTIPHQLGTSAFPWTFRPVGTSTIQQKFQRSDTNKS